MFLRLVQIVRVILQLSVATEKYCENRGFHTNEILNSDHINS